MYWEILPAYLIITIALAIPSTVVYPINYLAIRNFFRRKLETERQCWHYLRDRRLTGSPYVMAGLENIPDDDGDAGPKKCKPQKKKKKKTKSAYE